MGRLNLVAAGVLQHFGEKSFFHPAQTVLVEIVRGESEFVVDEMLQGAFRRRGRNPGLQFQFMNCPW